MPYINNRCWSNNLYGIDGYVEREDILKLNKPFRLWPGYGPPGETKMIAQDKSNGDYEITPSGVYHAICYGVIDLGTQFHPIYEKEQRKCIILWELPDITITIDGEELPRVQSKIYTLSLNKKAHLRHDLESWRGRGFSKKELEKGFELKALLGINCQLNIIHNYSEKNQREYANVESVIPLLKGSAKRTSKTDHIYFSWDEKMEIPDMPEWILNILMKCKEYNGGPQEQNDFEYFDSEPLQEPNFTEEDDIPF